MKVKNKDLVAGLNAYYAMLNEMTTCECGKEAITPVRILPLTLHKIKKNIKNLSDVYKEYEETRQESCKQFAKKDKDGNPIIKNNIYVIEDEETKKSLQQLIEAETEVNLTKLTLKEVEVSGANMNDLIYSILVDELGLIIE
jgi:hypothetical protein